MNGPLRSEDTIRDGELIGGHTPGFWAAKNRTCPTCGAKPAARCRSANGIDFSTLHVSRYATPEGETS